MEDFSTLIPANGINLAYRKTEGKAPGVLFCGGLMSDMTGTKAVFLERQCQKRGQAYVRFDYTGHGASTGRFEEGNIGHWFRDALAVFDQLTDGPQIVVGSSMGGWVSLLLARARPERIKGIVLIAAAPDFTEDIYHKEFSDADRATLARDGIVYMDSGYGEPYPLTQQLFDDGRKHLLLHETLPVACPVRLLHGKEDNSVPWQKSETIRDRLASKDVRITWIDDGDHRLSRDEDLKLLDEAVTELNRAA